ncbi:hypothetical protein [Sphingopyxis terrae]|uniref:hypothetical protein n=1 Tax=Sphingopyxis terrae TaxID=33052 RepID=UPI00362D8E33
MHAQRMLTFRFGANGTVSKVAFEIASETCRYRKFDAWGFLAARLAMGAVADADIIARRHEEVIAARLPVRSIEELPNALAFATAAVPSRPSTAPWWTAFITAARARRATATIPLVRSLISRPIQPPSRCSAGSR